MLSPIYTEDAKVGDEVNFRFEGSTLFKALVSVSLGTCQTAFIRPRA